MAKSAGFLHVIGFGGDTRLEFNITNCRFSDAFVLEKGGAIYVDSQDL